MIDFPSHAAGGRVAQGDPLPFTVRPVAMEPELLRVQRLRELAYGRHLPDQAAHFGGADPLDRDADVLVLMAEDKESGDVVGSVRIQVNRAAPLQIENSLALPAGLRGRLLCEITRLAVLPGYRSRGLVRPALIKACHLHNMAFQVGGILAGSRRQLLRQYFALGFKDLFGDGREVPLAHACGLPHRVLWLDCVSAEADARASGHPMHHFVFRAWHPDIDAVGARGLQGRLVSSRT